MRVKVNRSKCTGCLLCEVTCSLLHTGQVQREASAIRVNLGHLDHEHHKPVVCRQCKKMMCNQSENKEVGENLKQSFLWEKDLRKKEDCAFNALFAFGDKLVHCNLCGGEPECVRSCPTGALSLSA